MALKFLNKKGWHTGSLRNIENVWKAEQKHEAEQRKLEELRKQIQDEREKAEFRQIQEQAGFAPRQERLDFLYESGLAVGKGSSEGFKALQGPPAVAASNSAAEAGSSKAAAPGALFEDKPQSANDAWRKLHSDPLLLIRQREQEALARIKNNPIKMSMIKKSVEADKNKKQDKEKREKKRHKDPEKKNHKDHHHSKSKHDKRTSRHHSDLEDMSDQEEKISDHRTSVQHEEGKSKHGKWLSRDHSDSGYANEAAEGKRTSDNFGDRDSKHHNKHASKFAYSRRAGEYKDKRKEYRSPSHKRTSRHHSDLEDMSDQEEKISNPLTSVQHEEGKSRHGKRLSRDHSDSEYANEAAEGKRTSDNFGDRDSKHHNKHSSKLAYSSRAGEYEDKEYHSPSRHQNEKQSSGDRSYSKYNYGEDGKKIGFLDSQPVMEDKHGGMDRQNGRPGYGRRRGVPKMSEEERAARLREMQLDAELHEEQRSKRLKRAAEADTIEAMRAGFSKGKNFLDAAQKSIYGTEKGGSTTIEESVRRRTYYSQGSSAAHESNAFKR
ncbi:pre-mRNA-splicing factor [Canna indica]|uniref:Pre-mRNA-splicing factor n=1 Tax=Canna indica TaxID=4628 RepID=A0AAQ3QLE2_9LILI|nr:pre-mRNA-splicing factor [Canna indica]